VASGDFSPARGSVASRDEIGMLTESFNSMTLQLAEARAAAERHQAELAQAKAYVESILAHLSAGVLAFDENRRLTSAIAAPATCWAWTSPRSSTSNRSAGTRSNPGWRSSRACSRRRWRREGRATGEQQLERPHRGGRQQLLLRGTRLPAGTHGGRVVVFDDITHLAQAQRAAAWAEVARRLAHEIRNPADADPALRRENGGEACGQALRSRRRDAGAVYPDHRQPGRRH
jgi:nitrogen fixation/metabolism regulation signal transduction histidine kinase